MIIIINKEEFLEDINDILIQADIEELNVRLASDMNDEELLVHNKESANFYLKMINQLKEEQKQINDFTDELIKREVEKYEQYRADRLRPLESKISFYVHGLESFMRNENQENGVKTIKLPEGTLAIKKQQPKFLYDDNTIIDYLKTDNNLSYIKTKYEVDKKELKKAGTVINDKLFIDGKEVPGVIITPQDDKFEVR